MIQFAGNLLNVKIDRDGYSKITLEVPLSELQEVVKLAGLTERLLNVKIEEV